MLFKYTDKIINYNGEVDDITDNGFIPDELYEGLEEGATITDYSHQNILHLSVKKLADKAYRTILCCYRDMSMEEYQTLKNQNGGF